eukprot:TRINITY_DN7219_c0_g1_i1.p1 TRINITY_DN7219_c0_g1~~TRINITY_DN7219_c0_g1_i1.p1  ORF type:complete len:276 (+),score=38.36 TRINITY_DN7219_c0_g1_i1:159-986(+)
MVKIAKNKFASGAGDHMIKVWTVEEGCVQTLKGHTDYVKVLRSYEVNNTNNDSGGDFVLISGSHDKTVRLWKERRGGRASGHDVYELELTMKGHTAWVLDVTLLHQKAIASCSNDTTVKLWDWNTGNCTRTLKQPATSLAAADDGVLICGYPRAIRVLNIDSNGLRSATTSEGEPHEEVITVNSNSARMILLKNGMLLYGAGLERSIYVTETWMSKKRRTLLDRCCTTIARQPTIFDLTHLKSVLPSELHEKIVWLAQEATDRKVIKELKQQSIT